MINTHEHLLIDLSEFALSLVEASSKDLYQRSVDLNVIGYLENHALSNIDNFFLSKISTAIDEVTLYKEYGGSSIVDVTSVGLGRDPVGLHRTSRSTGVHIVMGSSYYVDAVHQKIYL